MLTETKIKGSGQEVVGNYIHMWSGVQKDQRAQAGVSILIKKGFKNSIKLYDFVSERIIRMDLHVLGSSLSVVGVYGPGVNETTAMKDSFEEQLRLVLEAVKNKDEVVVTGDLNARVGRDSNSQVVGIWGEDTLNDNGRRWRSLCSEFSLKIQNTFFQHKEPHKWTWTKPGFRPSILDYCITKQRSTMTVEDVRVWRGMECGSDHAYLEAKILAPWRKSRNIQDRMSKLPNDPFAQRYNLHLLHEDSVRDLFQRRLSGKLDGYVAENALHRYAFLKNSIHEAAKEALGNQVPGRRAEWLNAEVEESIKLKKRAYQAWLSSRTQPDWIRYKALNRQVKAQVSEARNKSWEDCCRRIDGTLGYNKVRECWRVLKSLKSSRKGSVVPLIGEKEWVDYYKALYTECRPEFLLADCEHQMDYEPLRVTQGEVEAAVRNAKSGKSPGPGGISVELLKAGGPQILDVVTEVINGILAGEEIPVDLLTGHLFSLYKKGDRRVCSNYRGICVQSSISRIFGRVLRDRLEQEYLTPEEQSGFTLG